MELYFGVGIVKVKRHLKYKKGLFELSVAQISASPVGKFLWIIESLQ